MKNKPQPIVVTTVCSLCGERWEAHGDDPTTLDCIRLLKAELARRPRNVTINYPTYPAYPQVWHSTTTANTTTVGTPRLAELS